ncbi:MAG TPA: hypothetical protein VJ865_04260, partial [Gemmatimonadaceae bacterium]|nr:hypothetical protein [Gemmatimonadaceae bacterium]
MPDGFGVEVAVPLEHLRGATELSEFRHPALLMILSTPVSAVGVDVPLDQVGEELRLLHIAQMCRPRQGTEFRTGDRGDKLCAARRRRGE